MSSVKDWSNERLCHLTCSKQRSCVVQDANHAKALERLCASLSSCRGLQARLKSIHNTMGCVTVTSCCGRLLSALSISDPICKIVVSGIHTHFKSHSDGALLCGVLAIKLIQQGLASGIHPKLVGDVYGVMVQSVVELLNRMSIQLELNKLHHVKAVIRSCLASKRCCCFEAGNVEFLISLVLSAHLQSWDVTSNLDYLQVLGVEGLPISESHLRNGICFPMPSWPIFRVKKINVSSPISVVLINYSLAGDSGEHPDGDCEVETGLDIDRSVMQILKKLVNLIIELHVSIVLVQRVVHPMLRTELVARGVYVIDRIGSTHMQAILKMTGGRLLSGISCTPTVSDLGCLSDVHHVVFNGRSYANLVSDNTPVSTIVLCNRSEQPLEELKHVVAQSRAVLQEVWRDPRGLAGGGCWAAQLLLELTDQVCCEPHVFSDVPGSRAQQTRITSAFRMAFQQALFPCGNEIKLNHMTDSVYHHAWPSTNFVESACENKTNVPLSVSVRDPTCMCGGIRLAEGLTFSYVGEKGTKSGSLLCEERESKTLPNMDDMTLIDPFPSMVNTVRLGVSMASMILGIANVLQ